MRRSKFVTVPAEPEKPEDQRNRDAGKTFIVTEVSAVEAEEWGLRALMALGTSGVVVPNEIIKAGLLGVVLVGYQAFMGAREDAVLPLWREMLPRCVTMKQSEGISMPWSTNLVEEVSTLTILRQAILELHTGFTLAELVKRVGEATSALQNTSSTTT